MLRTDKSIYKVILILNLLLIIAGVALSIIDITNTKPIHVIPSNTAITITAIRPLLFLFTGLLFRLLLQFFCNVLFGIFAFANKGVDTPQMT